MTGPVNWGEFLMPTNNKGDETTVNYSARHIFSGIIISLMCAYNVPVYADNADDYVRDMRIDDNTKTITVVLDESFADRKLTEKSVRKIYKKTRKDVRKALPKQYSKYDVNIVVGENTLESYLDQAPSAQDENDKKRTDRDKKRRGKKVTWWGVEGYDGNPWVKNVSMPHTVTHGLQGRHIALWASHGCYYDAQKERWKWQRPNMFCTTEDLFTQTIVVPYLMPMLERAGATVFSPRERDWQAQEAIVDNDDNTPYYIETVNSGRWTTTAAKGFAMPATTITDNQNPFEGGTVRGCRATKDTEASTATYTPPLKKSGRYAVYVSYATVEGSVSDASYTVYHQGQATEFRVNQRMGGGTWVYLGTFDFDASLPEYNKVVVSAQSAEKGIVTTDAVRFGGGMGNIVRGGVTSGMPRCLEGARYYAQWAGAPYEIYSTYQGTDDYKDDINVRSLMTNWLAGGSPYAPNKAGLGVPIDLTLAVHSDAGYHPDMESIYGSLAICTTNTNDGLLDAGVTRSRSKELCEQLLRQIKKDITSRYGYWEYRDLYDRNYSETRLPATPSAIIETLSHQSFPDMLLGHDPDFKFTLARSIYKTILRYEAKAYGKQAVVTPLQPHSFAVTLDRQGVAHLTWEATKDNDESSASPDSYNVYTAMGGFDFDNGTNIKEDRMALKLVPNLIYRFRVTAVNRGGESFPSEELSVVWQGTDARNIIVINGFERLSPPAVVNTATTKGFDIADDVGMSYGMTAGWSGKQQIFSTATAGREGAGTFAYSGDEMAGHFVAGNSFNYVTEHVRALIDAGAYNIVSSSREAVENGRVSLRDYDAVDLILGNERYDRYAHRKYKTFSKRLQQRLLDYQQWGGGGILVSGSYVGSDMQSDSERGFLRSLLHTELTGTVRNDNAFVSGLQQTLYITNTLNADHYATVQSDVLHPTGNAFVAMQYNDLQTAAVAYKGATNTFCMGFPLECITHSGQRSIIMKGIMNFLLSK